MKKVKIVCLVLASALLLTCGFAVAAAYTSQPVTCTVRYITNYPQQVVLQSGKQALADNVLFFSSEVVVGQKLQCPAEVPQRDGYDFGGWCLDKDGHEPWDFQTDVVKQGVTLFAKWQRSSQQQIEYVEPTLTFVETIDDSVQGLQLWGVCNQNVKDGGVELTYAAIQILQANAQDVRENLNYKRSSDTQITSCTYQDGNVVVNYTVGTAQQTLQIAVTDVTAQLKVSNSTYENKAQKYEKDVFASYGIVLAGSSSMENWATSTHDMQPVTTINHGIGGTTVDHWINSLAQRLIYPYNPRGVVLYVGINNIINSNESGSVTGEKLLTLFNEIHSHLPNATVYFVLVNTVPLAISKNVVGEIDICNQIVQQFAADKTWLQLIDAGAGLMKQSGLPNAAYFLKSDGLHMTLSGYVIWGGAIKNFVINYEQELYK